MNNIFSKRDKSILTGLYLSKFDMEGIKSLGFESIREAINTLGYALGSKPASLKNYRDEFDPYYPNPRKGWHKRSMREYCKVLFDEFGKMEFTSFSELVKSFFYQENDVESFIASVETRDYTSSIAKRLLTGAAAEEYFKANYSEVADFKKFTITDTTKNACGFDFKLDFESDFYCIEVKGLNTLKGSVSLTEKEYKIATSLTDKYCLFIVSNFIDTPQHQIYFDPLHSELSFTKTERKIIQTTYYSSI